MTLQGSALVAQILKAAEPLIKEELGVELRVNSEGGSTVGFMAVGAGVAQLAMMTRQIEPPDRALFPASSFDEAQIGWQVLVPAVARDVWESGIRALTRDQIRGIYEGDIRNWNQIGGADQPIKFYNPKRGRGVWELFAKWLYTDLNRAPLGEKFESVVLYTDARDAVFTNLGSISVMPPDLADGKTVFALGIKEPDGKITQPTPELLQAKKYPLSCPLMIVSGRRIAGDSRHLINFLLAPRGQAIVKSLSFAPVGEVDPNFTLKPKKKPKPVVSDPAP